MPKRNKKNSNKAETSGTQTSVSKFKRRLSKVAKIFKSSTSQVETTYDEFPGVKSKLKKEYKEKLQLMIDYINQDACEKIDEIDTRAAEEYQNEKIKLIEEEYAKVYELYDKLETRYQTILHRITSNSINRGRLFILRARFQHINEFINDARNALDDVADPDDPKYIQTMKLLILEGLLMLLESKVILKVRDKDRNLVENMLKNIETEYNTITQNKGVELKLDDANLSLSSRGGVILSDSLKRVFITNTLNARLDVISHQLHPVIRKIVWDNKPIKIMDYMKENFTPIE